ELYDLRADPKELKNLVRQDSQIPEQLLARLKQIEGSHTELLRRSEEGDQIHLPSEEVERLKTLGYM
ncbi:MAG: hypothetical protein DCC75_07040, partial [Proteobacteria bacterium]